MQQPFRATSSLSRRDAKVELDTLAQTLRSLGLTQEPNRMCVGLRKYGQGWAVYVGYQDSDNIEPVETRIGRVLKNMDTGGSLNGRHGNFRFA